MIDNVAVFVENRNDEEPDLLGLYEGQPLTEREDYGGMVLPDRVTIYRWRSVTSARTRTEIVHEVVTTVIHEVAHHFGIDDDRLTELGWD